jgi:hypothetical protein
MIKGIDDIIALLRTGWCKDACATDKNGKIVAYNSRKAKKFSLYGAVHRCIQGKSTSQFAAFQAHLEKASPCGSTVKSNDEAETVEEVIAICQAARIEMLRIQRSGGQK